MRFFTARIDWRYEKIAARSASVKFLYIGLGMGGTISRPRPRCRRSGVRFAVMLTPQGPANAVLVTAAVVSHGSGGYDDEDALMMLCGQFAVAMSLMQPTEPDRYCRQVETFTPGRRCVIQCAPRY